MSDLDFFTFDKEKKEPEETKKTNHSLPTPTRCVGCGKSILVRDDKVIDEVLESRILKCASSSDPTCSKATKRPEMVSYINRATKNVNGKRK